MNAMSTFVRPATLIVGTVAAAAAMRFALLEPEPIVHLCGSAGAPWWCTARSAAIAAFATNGLAVVAVAAGILAVLARSSRLALAAACLGMAGLVLYSVESGAVAFLLGVLVLARPRHARRERTA